MFGVVVATAAPEIPADRTERLRNVPVTVYPDFDPRGSSLVGVCNGLLRSDDALVVSYTDAFKGAFRIADVGVNRGQVWVYVAGVADLGQTYRKNLEGVGGIVYVPDRLGTKPDARRAAGELADQAKVLGVPLVVGLEERDLRSTAAVADVARSGAIFTIYANAHLAGPADAYRRHIEKTIRTARSENPQIKIELAIAATANPVARRHLLALVSANIDLADRVAIYCDDSQASLESLTALFGLLRPVSGKLAAK